MRFAQVHSHAEESDCHLKRMECTIIQALRNDKIVDLKVHCLVLVVAKGLDFRRITRSFLIGG